MRGYFTKTKGAREQKKGFENTGPDYFSQKSKIFGWGGEGYHHAETQYTGCLPISQPQYWRQFPSFRTKCSDHQSAPPWHPLKAVKLFCCTPCSNVETNIKKDLFVIYRNFFPFLQTKSRPFDSRWPCYFFLFSDGVAEVLGSCDKRRRVFYQWNCPAMWGSCYCWYTRTASWCEGTVLHQKNTTLVGLRVSCVTNVYSRTTDTI